MQCSSKTLNDVLINDLARCVADCEMDPIELVFFRQCGHESAGCATQSKFMTAQLRVQGRSWEYGIGWGVKYAGTGWIQVTGAYWHRLFSEYIGDPKVFDLGKTYTSEKYPGALVVFGGGKTT